MAHNLSKLEQKREIIDYLVKNQPSAIYSITGSVEISRSTVSKRLGEMADNNTVFKKANPSAKPDEPRHYWIINPEEAKNSEVITDQKAEEIVSDNNYMIKELSHRGLLKNPTMGEQVKDFLEEMIERGYVDIKKDELNEGTEGLSQKAHLVFMDLWMDAIKPLENIQIQGELSVKIQDKSGTKDRDLLDEALYMLNEELIEEIDLLPTTEEYEFQGNDNE